jgi:hypothetical protein
MQKQKSKNSSIINITRASLRKSSSKDAVTSLKNLYTDLDELGQADVGTATNLNICLAFVLLDVGQMQRDVRHKRGDEHVDVVMEAGREPLVTHHLITSTHRTSRTSHCYSVNYNFIFLLISVYSVYLPP